MIKHSWEWGCAMSGHRQDSTKALLVGLPPPEMAAVKAMFVEQGYDVQATTDGQAALEAILKRAPDLILLAADLPDMHSHAFIKRLRTGSPGSNAPVICLIPRGDLQASAQVFGVGGTDYVTTPVQKDEVFSRIKTHLTLREMQARSANQHTWLERGERQPAGDF